METGIRPSSVPRRVIAIALVFVLLAGGFFVYRRQVAKRAAAAKAPKYSTATVQKGDLRIAITGTGATQAYQSKPVVAGTTGTVEKILVKEGDQVKAGQALMIVDNDAAGLAVEQAKSDLQVQTDKLSDLTNPKNQVRAAVSGTVSKVYVSPGATVAANDVMAELDNDSALLALRQAQLDLQTQEDKLRDVQKSVGGQSQDVEALKLKVTQAELNLQSRQADADRLTVKAVGPGRVTQVNVSVGDDVAVGQTLITSVDDTTILFNVSIPETQLRYLAIGQTASAYFFARGESVNGTVTAIANDATTGGKSATYQVTIEVSNPGWIRGGMTGTGTINGKYTNSDGSTTTVTLSGSGTAGYKSKDELKAKIAGKVASLAVGVDSAVTTGQALIVLTSESVDLALRQAQNDLALANSNLAAATSSDLVKQQLVKVDQARLTVQSKQADVDALKIRAAVAGKVENVYVHTADRLSANALVADVRPSNPDPTTVTTDITAQRLKVEQAKLTLQNKTDELDALVVKSPIGGIFTTLQVIESDKVNNGTKLGTVVNYNRVLVNITVDELDVVKAVVGQQALVTIDALPDRTFQAEVTEISTEGTQNQGVANFKVSLEVKDPKGLRGGMTAQVDIAIEDRKGVLLVPSEAVVGKGNQRNVRVMGSDGTLEIRRVTVGLVGESQTEIVKGLTEGETIVTGTTNTSTNQQRSGLNVLNPNRIGVPGGGQIIKNPGR